jgi:hypothetical protein
MSSKRGTQTATTGVRNRQRTTDELGYLEADAHPCRTCATREDDPNHDIDDEVLRVVGDNDGRVPVCRECYDSAQGREWTSTVSAVVHYRGARGREVSE